MHCLGFTLPIFGNAKPVLRSHPLLAIRHDWSGLWDYSVGWFPHPEAEVKWGILTGGGRLRNQFWYMGKELGVLEAGESCSC